jgi:hypothetical protein
MDRRSTRRVVSFLAITFLLALNSSAAAQAMSTTTSTTSPFGGTIGGTCQQEVISISGQTHATFHTTINAQGDSNLVIHINVHGGGVGETTGTRYEFNQSTNQVFNRHGSGALEFTSMDFIRVIAAGNQPDDDFFLRSQIHVTLNAQGEVTAQVRAFERVCE